MTDVDADAAARRAARRRVARQHHPDLGGDVEQFVAALAALDRVEVPPTSTPTHLVRSARGRAAALVRRPAVLADRLARRLPRALPGARRYGHL